MNLTKAMSLLALSVAASLIFAARGSAQTKQSSNVAPPSGAVSQESNKPAAQTSSKPTSSSVAPAAKPLATVGQPAPRFINCHALETHASAQPAVTIVVFNQRDKPDHTRLSDLLKGNDGAAVELRTSDGKWHKATVARLRSCFGRGVLFLAGDAGDIKDRDNFLLRFPPKKIS